MTEYRYRRNVLDGLWIHGVQPRTTTSPELVREFVNDLYRYELRRLRDGLRRQEIAKDSYFMRVVELRRKYPLLSLRASQWLED